MSFDGKTFFMQHGKSITAIALIVAAYGFATSPDLSRSERASMAMRFHFERAELPSLPGSTFRSVRGVNPSLEHISSWISAVGAAVALHDLDGDGLANDAAYVDARTDQAIVCPVPGTPERYVPFELSASPLPYDPATMAPMGCLPGDFNEDGLADMLVYYWGRTPVMFLRRASHPLVAEGFEPVELVARPERWYTNAATQADLDGDGHCDLVFGNYFGESERILDTQAATSDYMQRSMSRAYNGGRNRIMLCVPADAGETSSSPAALFREVDGALDEKRAHEWTLAVGAQDLDQDLRPELYFANDFGPDCLLHNLSTPGHLRFEMLHGEKHFTTPNSKALGRDSFKGMGVDFGDLNGDGIPDMLVSNITAEYALEESHFAWLSTGAVSRMGDGIAPYVDRSEPLGLSRSGWSWEARLDDFDNDGVLEAMQATGFVKGKASRWPELQELAIGNDDLLEHAASWPRVQPGDDLSGHQHNPFFVRARNGRYYDLARDLGIDHTEVSRGIATADFDGDGDLDFVVANQWEPSYAYTNLSPAPGAFLGLHLLLPPTHAGTAAFVEREGHPAADTPGRPAIGAAARVRLGNGRTLIGQVDGGNGHSGKRSPDLHFGLGTVESGARVSVDLSWRDGHGNILRRTLELVPGWHTIVLGAAAERAPL